MLTSSAGPPGDSGFRSYESFRERHTATGGYSTMPDGLQRSVSTDKKRYLSDDRGLTAAAQHAAVLRTCVSGVFQSSVSVGSDSIP